MTHEGKPTKGIEPQVETRTSPASLRARFITDAGLFRLAESYTETLSTRGRSARVQI